MIRMGVSGCMFLLVPAYPGCPGSKAVKRSSLLLLLLFSPAFVYTRCGRRSAVAVRGVAAAAAGSWASMAAGSRPAPA